MREHNNYRAGPEFIRGSKLSPGAQSIVSPSSLRLVEIALLLFVVAAGFVIRMVNLDAKPFWVDEAESSINALTILKHGYPSDTYLGLPIYENIHVKLWPDNAEYAYRDVSYSRHFAVYHGWLPLYAIAGSFALAGVHPDQPDASRAVKYNLNEWLRRTRAARLPGVLFGTIFLLVVFVGGTVLYGRDAGWSALILGSVFPYHISISQQARYYSAEVTLTTACCVAIWTLFKYAKWRHFLIAAALFVLLFYTHLLGFCTAVFCFALLTPFICHQHERSIPKLAVFCSLVAICTLPWIWVTGFYSHQGGIPRAWSLLRLPSDLFKHPPLQPSYAMIGLLVGVGAWWVVQRGPTIRHRVVMPAVRLWSVLLFLSVWAAVAYISILVFMPAVSFDTNRLNLIYWGPLLLLTSTICAAAARMLAPRFSVEVAPALFLLFFFCTGHRFGSGPQFANGDWKALAPLFDRLSAMQLPSTTKLYAAPNDQLILTFYSGLPIQSMTPVRKSYLDSYRGEIIYIDGAVWADKDLLTPQKIQQAALLEGYHLPFKSAQQWSALLLTRDYREAMLKALAWGGPTQIEVVPPFAEHLLNAERERARHVLADSSLQLMTRGFDMRTWSDWRSVMMYRFVDPKAHSGIHTNYLDRIRGAEATILVGSNVAIYRSRWHPADVRSTLTYTFEY